MAHKHSAQSTLKISRRKVSVSVCSVAPLAQDGLPAPVKATSLPCQTFYLGPEEEVFPLSPSLEDVCKAVFPVWPGNQENNDPDFSLPSSLLQPSILEKDEAHSVSELVTPGARFKTSPNETKIKQKEVVKKKLTGISYVPLYQCEDILDYAVDLYNWKKSLEVEYLPGNWTRWV